MLVTWFMSLGLRNLQDRLHNLHVWLKIFTCFLQEYLKTCKWVKSMEITIYSIFLMIYMFFTYYVNFQLFHRLILLTEILALNKSALCHSASLSFSFVQLHFEWRLVPASLHQRSGKTEPVQFIYTPCRPLHLKVIKILRVTPRGYILREWGIWESRSTVIISSIIACQVSTQFIWEKESRKPSCNKVD